MPEIAEVETVRKILKKKILNKQIIDVNISYEKMIENDINYFKKVLINNTFKDILRKGKYLIFELKEHYLISHLRMEGKYFCESLPNNSKHTHVIFKLSDNTYLSYNDVRKFGKMKIIEKTDLERYFKKLGKEPKDLNLDYLKNKISKSNKNIKTILLDQSIIAGLGNIYANEVLFASLINPKKIGKNLTDEEISKIIQTSIEIVNLAIKNGGTTIKSYTSSLNQKGSYQKFLKVHMKENKHCCNCNSIIIKEKINGRSTYYCESCQK